MPGKYAHRHPCFYYRHLYAYDINCHLMRRISASANHSISVLIIMEQRNIPALLVSSLLCQVPFVYLGFAAVLSYGQFVSEDGAYDARQKYTS